MTTPTSLAAIIPPVNDHDAAFFAAQWHRGSRHLAVRTTPVIAVVQELLTILGLQPGDARARGLLDTVTRKIAEGM